MDAPTNRSWSAELQRTRLRIAAELGLQWLENSDTAQVAIREILGRARRSVTVVDPYFGPSQMRDFAMAVSAADVSIRIVTSEECMSRIPKGSTELTAEAMERVIVQYVMSGWSQPEVLVMKGRHAPLHDRFLIADGRVWLSGNSLNAIGRRASVLIEIPNADEIVRRLTPFVEASEEFSTWLAALRAIRLERTVADSNTLPEAD